jgi:hypothetical protein
MWAKDSGLAREKPEADIMWQCARLADSQSAIRQTDGPCATTSRNYWQRALFEVMVGRNP